MAVLAGFAKKRVEDEPEVRRVFEQPSQQQLEVALGWLVRHGVRAETARMALSKAVNEGLVDGREWLAVLQGVVNRGIREAWPGFKGFSGDWLLLRQAVEQVKRLEETLDEAGL